MNRRCFSSSVFLILTFFISLFLFSCSEPEGDSEADFFSGIYYNRQTDAPDTELSEPEAETQTKDTAESETSPKSDGVSDSTDTNSEPTKNEDSSKENEEAESKAPSNKQDEENENAAHPSKNPDNGDNTQGGSVCTHQYTYICSDTCVICGNIRHDSEPHIFDIESSCEDMTCKLCGFIIYQEHELRLTGNGTADLINPGTFIFECTKCNKSFTDNSQTPLAPAMLGMPIIRITNMQELPISMPNLEASGSATVKCKYTDGQDEEADFECCAVLSIDENTPSGIPKKDLSIELYKYPTLGEKNEVDIGLGNTSRYLLTANYTDFLNIRQSISMSIFLDMLKCRGNINPSLMSADNYGIALGFPVLLYIGENFYGIYTLTTPIDEQLFSMDGGEEAHEAILVSKRHTANVDLSEELGEFSGIVSTEENWSSYGFSLEYCSNSDSSWVKESFNELISVLNCGNRTLIINELPEHLDIDAAIDYMLFTYFTGAAESSSANILWATYDGKLWIPSLSNACFSFGKDADGMPYEAADAFFPKINLDQTLTVPGCKMYSVLVSCFADKVKERYLSLRHDLMIFTEEYTEMQYSNYILSIHETAYNSELLMWGGEDGAAAYKNDDLICSDLTEFVKNRIKGMYGLDTFFLTFQSFLN